MNCAIVAFPQGVGAFLMLGYGERSSPCRQRYKGRLCIVSRELTWRILPKVIARPASGFGFRGFAAVFARLIQVQKSSSDLVRVSCNTRTLCPMGPHVPAPKNVCITLRYWL